MILSKALKTDGFQLFQSLGILILMYKKSFRSTLESLDKVTNQLDYGISHSDLMTISP